MTVKSRLIVASLVVTLLVIVFYNNDAFAAVESTNLMDDLIRTFKARAKTWENVLQQHAMWLFLTLGTISLVWQFGQMLYHQSSIADYVWEMVRFVVIMGLFQYLILNAGTIAKDVIKGFTLLGLQASGSTALSPSKFLDTGFNMFMLVCDRAPWLSLTSLCARFCAFVFAIIMAIIAANMTLQLCSAYLMSYAGIIFLGFAGHQITRDIAINYIRTLIGVGGSLMTMYLLAGICENEVATYYNKMTAKVTGADNALVDETMVLVFVAIITFMLINKLPQMVSGLLTGSSIAQSTNVGSYGGAQAWATTMLASQMIVKHLKEHERSDQKSSSAQSGAGRISPQVAGLNRFYERMAKQGVDVK